MKRNMDTQKELAFRYDLIVAPEWRDRFDTLVNESIQFPVEGRFLDVNCGTGEHAIELADQLKDKGEVIGVDPSEELISLARAKAQIKKEKNVTFDKADPAHLTFADNEFDVVIGDASMTHVNQIGEMLSEMVRVARSNGKVILKLTTHGSFDEFFSIYWEALHDVGIADSVWGSLEQLIKERWTLTDAEQEVERSGLRNVESFTRKEEFQFESSDEFLKSPLIADLFLSDWIKIAPQQNREEILKQIASIIDRERKGTPFEVSIKAAVISGTK
jgi:ubiquinone/menaquinone biosynthesis C-methylase UbiE